MGSQCGRLAIPSGALLLISASHHSRPDRALPGPAVAVKEPPHSRDRATDVELAADQRSDAFQGSPLDFPATRGRPFGQLLLQLGEAFVRQLRQFRGSLRLQTSMPHSRQARRHCSTERSLTRRPLAMSEVLSPRANLCPASSRITSRAARRSAVRPPPSAYRITPAYRRDHPTSPPERNPKRSVSAASGRGCGRGGPGSEGRGRPKTGVWVRRSGAMPWAPWDDADLRAGRGIWFSWA